MSSELAIRLFFYAIGFVVAMKCLMSLADLLREHLQGLLVAHVKRQQIEALKRKRIAELRDKIRAKKAESEMEHSKKAA
jgi:hypothetical protein